MLGEGDPLASDTGFSVVAAQIPPPAQQFLAGRMGATLRSVASSHAPFMSQPAVVADIIAKAATASLHGASA
jgi:hypothetical protein